MPKLLIIADDFTGSLDTGVQFAKRGIDTLVTVWRDGHVDLKADCQVLVVNTESRHIPAVEACQRVAALVVEAQAAGFDAFYKKTDSTLRGNIGGELSALLEQIPSNELIFVPAFPKSKRYTIKGLQYVGDQLLAETAFANDPFNPIRQSDVKGIIAEQTELPVENIFIEQYDRLKDAPGRSEQAGEPGQPALSVEAEATAGETPGASTGKTIRVVDAKTDDDLQTIGQILKAAGKLHFLAGCAGFAELLPELLELELSSPSPDRPQGSMLLVSGSVNPMSLKQVQHALDQCGFASSLLSVDQKIDAARIDRVWEQRLSEQLSQNGRAAIWSKRAERSADDAQVRAESLGIKTDDLASLIAGNIGAIVKRTLDGSPIGTLIVFGGDTLLGIADQIGSHLMRPVSEIVPGVVLARFDDSRFSFNVVTKAGGFGGEDVVERIVEFLFSPHTACR